MKRGFYFNTIKGNNYYYDDITGKVVNGEKGSGIIFGEQIEDFNDIVNPKDIEKYLTVNGFQQLTLMITEDCNIRCKYCVYSGNYTNSRVHGNNCMDFSIAKEAVVKYLEGFKSVKNRNPFLVPAIGFYGGEPLLNYKLIRQVVQFCKEIYPNDIHYNMTTNAILLDDDKIAFLADNKFSLSVSLNGDREEHNRLRVFKDGTGTYDIVSKKINRIKELYPDYYKKYCSLLITFDWGTDLIKLNEFITKNMDNLPLVAKITPVSALFTDWYDRYPKELRRKQQEDMELLREKYIQQLKLGKPDQLLKVIFGLEYFTVLNRPLNLSLKESKVKFLPYTGACVPGTKVAVNSQGKLHFCERVSEATPIGDVNSWLDYDKISEFLVKYNKAMIHRCSSCPIQRLCDICYSHVIDNNGEVCKDDELCDSVIQFYVDRFSKAWDLMEDDITFDDILSVSKNLRGC